MPEHPLYVALVWHMHQPYYRDLKTGEIPLPWVRLHAAKDYLHMAQVLARYPGVHLTINLVPSLIDQILAWAEGREQDRLATLAGQDGWDEEERRLILNLCFSISWDNIIRRYPRYRELLERRPAALANSAEFSPQDYRDLLAWFNLAWIDPNYLEQDPVLAGLVARARDFTTADLAAIHGKQRQIAGAILPLYRELVAAGRLEVSVTPYYHPILPLLIDTSSARRASPDLPLPSLRLQAPDDAAVQLQAAVDRYRQIFGAAPNGLYPSEGAVSFELLPLVSAAGFRWLAGDEAILARSLGRRFERDGSGLLTAPHALYQSYRVLAGPELGPAIVFRDHELSDRIGFLYQGFPGQQGAEDLIYRLLEIRSRLDDPGHPSLVTIILDGENCWEHYEHNGDPFLTALYEMLSERRERGELAAVTVGEYLAAHRTGGTLAHLATGSWIGGDLTTWIGDPEHNRAWDALARTRGHLVARTAATRPAAGAGAPAANAGASPEPPAPDAGPANRAANAGPSPETPAPDAPQANPAANTGASPESPTAKAGPANRAANAGPSPETPAPDAPPANPAATAGASPESPTPNAGPENLAGVAGSGRSEPDAGRGAVTSPDPALVPGRPPDLALAWRALSVAEGSDWFWWYSHRNHSDQDAVFDRLFRHDLAAVWEALGEKAPAWLEQPIYHPPLLAAGHAATRYITPPLTGAPAAGDEWAPAAVLRPAGASTGTMQRAGTPIERLFVGHDRQSLYLRLELRERLDTDAIAVYLGARPGRPANQRPVAPGGSPGDTGFAFGWQIELPPGRGAPLLYRAAGEDQWQFLGPITSALGPQVVEIALPLNAVDLEPGQDLSLVVTLARQGAIVAQLPEEGMQRIALPDFDRAP